MRSGTKRGMLAKYTHSVTELNLMLLSQKA